MVVIVFRARFREGAEAELESLGRRMYELASAMPGFLSYKDFTAADGENLSLIEFASLEALNAWRDHPEHRQAQRRGQEALFSQYHIQVCTPERDYSFP